MRAIIGADPIRSGEIILEGKKIQNRSPHEAMEHGIVLVPEDRKLQGILSNLDISDNINISMLDKNSNSLGFVDAKKEEKIAEDGIKNFKIKTPSAKKKIVELSGGNQQKVAVAKWLAADCDVYIFDEPTKGVDVGAKQEIFHLINQIAKDGNCVIYATCENSELLSITDRMYVMYDGRIMAELETAKTTEDEIMHYATGSEEKYAG